MNYLAAGLQQGWDTGSRAAQAAADEKRRRTREEELQKLAQTFQMEQDARRQAFEKSVLGDKFSQEARMLGLDQLFRGTESDKGRQWQTGERVGGQHFQAGESQLRRKADRRDLSRRLDADAKRHTDNLALGRDQLAAKIADQVTDQGLRARGLEEQAKANALRFGADDSPPLGGAPGAGAAGAGRGLVNNYLASTAPAAARAAPAVVASPAPSDSGPFALRPVRANAATTTGAGRVDFGTARNRIRLQGEITALEGQMQAGETTRTGPRAFSDAQWNELAARRAALLKELAALQ